MRFRYSLIFLLFHFMLGAQTQTPPYMTFGQIAPADLHMKVYEPDTTAAAVVLGDYENISITIDNDVLVRKERHRRVKILKKSGFHYGDIEIPFYSYKKQEQFFFDRATIYAPSGNFVKLTREDIFIEKINEFWSKARFTFPNLEAGSIIEYTYFINSDRYYKPEDWFFQGSIPVRHSQIRIKYPYMLNYTYFFQGNEGMRIIKEEEGLTVLEGINGTCTIKPGIYTFENAPAMKEESYITTMDDYRARIRFQLSKIHYSDGRVQEVTSSWKELKKELFSSPYFGFHFLKKGHYKDVVEPISGSLAKKTSQIEKAAFIYNYITRNISWNGQYNFAAGADKLKTVVTRGTGSSGQINLILLVLLREAGIEANPVLTSTRSHGKMYEDSPLLDQFNHLIIAAEIKEQQMLIDATELLRPMGYPDVAALNGRGWHLEEGWINIKAPKESMDAYMTELVLSEEGHLSGQIAGGYRGYNAIPERRHYLDNLSGTHWTNRLSENFAEVFIDTVIAGQVLNLDQMFTDTIQFKIEEAAMSTGDHLYFSPILFSNFSENPFKLQQRNYPVNFPYPIREQHNITIQLPPGYSVEELPKNVRTSLPGKGGSFIYAIDTKVPGKLKCNIMMNIKQLKFEPYEYPAVKELFDLFVEKLNEQIVLVKNQ